MPKFSKMRSGVLVGLFIWGALSAGLQATPADEGFYYRFWRGNSYSDWNHLLDAGIRPPVGQDTFNHYVNKWLIPATISCCAVGSLHAYMPVFPPKNSPLHDEIALIVYRSEKEYLDVRNGLVGTPSERHEAEEYGPVHGLIFDKGEPGTPEASGSVVPTFWSSDSEVQFDEDGHAKAQGFDVTGTRHNWQQDGTDTYFVASFPVPKEEATGSEVKVDLSFKSALEDYMRATREMGESGQIRHHLVLISAEHVLEYINLDTAADSDVASAWKTFLESEPRKIYEQSFARYNPMVTNILQFSPKLIRLERLRQKPLEYTMLGYGSGGQVVFESGVKPGQAVHPLLDPNIISPPAER